MRTRVPFVFGVLLVLAGVVAPPAQGRDQGSLGTVGPKKTLLRFEGPPIPGVYPASNSPRQPFAGFRPPTCRTSAYCDAMEFEIDYPKNYLRDVLFGLTITLSWDNPRHHEKNPNGNDLDLFVWGDDGPAAGGPLSKCGSPGVDDCDDIHPEVVTITEPSDTVPEKGEEEPDPAAVYLTIVNDVGVNAGGYQIDVEFYEFEIDKVKPYIPPDRETSAERRNSVSGPFDDFSAADALGPAEDGPEPTPRKILIPGPDGKMHEIELPAYAAGQRLSATAERNGAVPWIVAGIVGALALAALIFMLARRNRQAMRV